MYEKNIGKIFKRQTKSLIFKVYQYPHKLIRNKFILIGFFSVYITIDTSLTNLFWQILYHLFLDINYIMNLKSIKYKITPDI